MLFILTESFCRRLQILGSSRNSPPPILWDPKFRYRVNKSPPLLTTWASLIHPTVPILLVKHPFQHYPSAYYVKVFKVECILRVSPSKLCTHLSSTPHVSFRHSHSSPFDQPNVRSGAQTASIILQVPDSSAQRLGYVQLDDRRSGVRFPEATTNVSCFTASTPIVWYTQLPVESTRILPAGKRPGR